MKQKRLGKRIAAWFLCLAMVLTAINLPGFSSTVNAAEPIEVNSWATMKDAISNVNDGDIIKLSGNVVATETDSAIEITSHTFTLDLNGYTINRNLTSAKMGGCVFWIRGLANLTIIDSSVDKTGTITGGFYVNSGGAIGLESGTLKLLGGTITGNKTSRYGGGIWADCANATLILGGTAKVVSNAAQEDGDTEVTSNIHLNNNRVDGLKVGTGDEALVSGTAQIGIRFWIGLESVIPDTICDIPDEATANCFEADNDGYAVFADNTSGSYKLVIKSHDHDYNGDTSCKATCIVCGRKIENGTHSFNSDKCDATCIGCGKRIENGAHTWSTEDCSAVCTGCGAYKVSGHSFDANGDCTVCGIKQVTEVSDGVYTDNQGLKYSLIKGEMQVGINDAYLSDHTELNVILPKKIVAGESAYGNFAIKIGESANCAKLKSIAFPEGLTSIPYRAFKDCTGLTSITLPDTVTQIDAYAFAGCSNLKNVSLPEGLTTIGDNAFSDCVAIKPIVIPATVIEIGGSAFYNCDSLESVTIPKGVTIIKTGTFKGCSTLKSIVIPDTVTEIGGSAFYECNLLENVIIPENVISIGGEAFYGCWSLKSVIIPEGVTYIGTLAFHGCSSLAKATIPASVETVEGFPFLSCSEENLVLDIACTPTLREVSNWGVYKTINWIHDYEGQPYVPDEDGINHHQKCKNCDATSVSGNHDFSKQPYQVDEDGKHYQKCKDCGAESTHEAHTGGTATCKAKAKCSVCGKEYGELAAHKGGTATCKVKAKCSVCGEEYGSLAAHTYATKWSTDATNHWHACTVCGAKKDNAAHADSDKNEKCDTCDYNMHSHSGTKVAQVDATCTSYGVKAYYKCSCGKYYSDSACTKEITDLAAWKSGDGRIEKKDHAGGTATCKEKAKCSTCGKEYGDLAAHKYDTKWTTDGTNHWKACTVCGAKKDSAAHTLKTTTTKATFTANGKKETKCSVCGKVTKTTTIYAAKTIKLSATAYTYDGKVKKPTVTVKDSKGNAIASTNYTVTYPTGRKNVGKYTVKVTFKGNYSGSKSLTFKINPPKTAISSVSAGKKAFTVKWSKKTTQVTGYQIQYSTSSSFASGNKTVTVTSNKTVSKTISKLTGGKKYYVRVRTYKTVSGTKYYSDWSAKKSVTTKK